MLFIIGVLVFALCTLYYRLRKCHLANDDLTAKLQKQDIESTGLRDRNYVLLRMLREQDDKLTKLKFGVATAKVGLEAAKLALRADRPKMSTGCPSSCTRHPH